MNGKMSGFRLCFWGMCAVVWQAAFCTSAPAQSGLRESLERLDRNKDGEIEPREITSLARPYLTRVAEVRRMDLERANSIEKWLEAARIYYAFKNGVADKSIVPAPTSMVKSFTPEPDQPLVPEFGLAEVKYAYTQSDLEEADAQLRRADRNRDGYIDRLEALEVRWTHRDPFEEDADQDGRLNRLELAQRYARRRLVKSDSDDLIQKTRESINNSRPTPSSSAPMPDDSQMRRSGNRYYLTISILSRFDLNRNGILEADEAVNLGIPVSRMDINLDGEVSRDELFDYLSELQDEAGTDANGLPGWFYELDTDRDNQVTMAEFTSEWTEEKIEDFTSLDYNGDGLLTTAELIRSKAMIGGSYSNGEAQVLPPRKTIVSEIVVNEDFLIRDLDLQLSITHSNVSDLDVHLIGPDGQRILLFAGIGGNDNNFDNTLFDDQASEPITKARAPYIGSFLTQAAVTGAPSLSHYNAKSVSGVWQLSVSATRSERFGMLHKWALIVKPQ